MIPKKLHYCWFGKKSKPESFEKCLASWKRCCPDFEIIEWNEKNAPNRNQKFYKNALRKKKYAFVSDAVRAVVLNVYGGIYMDTDMLLLKPVTALLKYQFFSGEEVNGRVAYGLFGSVPKHRFLKEMTSFYENNYFNQFSPPVITHTFMQLIQHSELGNNEIIFTPEVFYPLPYEQKEAALEDYITKKSMAVHLWDHSWKETQEETVSALLEKIRIVLTDYFFYGYPASYCKRYLKEFGRKLYHKLFR